MNPLRPRNWIISRQQRWQYLWSISISPGIPNSRRRKKTSLLEKQIQGRQQMIDKDRGPQIHDHNLYISVMSWFMDHRKKGPVFNPFFFCVLRLSGINWCHSLTVSYRLPAANTFYKVELPSWSLNYLKESCCFQARWKWDVAGVSGNRPWTMR